MMKKLFLLLLMINMNHFANAQTKIIWTCPMHPQIKMDKPGKCPICGMTLVKKTVKGGPIKSVDNMKMPKENIPAQKEIAKDTVRKMEMPMKEDKTKMPVSGADSV